MTPRFLLVCLCVGLAACDKDPPSPPNAPGGGVEQITGSERIGWDQRAPTAAELVTFRYNVYVDNVARELQGVTCADVPAAAGFACSAQLPSLSPGQHTLALSAFVDAGTRLESARSATLTVNVGQGSSTSLPPAAPAVSWTTLDGVRLRAVLVASGLDDPTDMAMASDGRMFVAERNGRIRVMRNGALQPVPAIAIDDVVVGQRRGLLSVAIDPEYLKNGHVYAVYTTADGFRLARFRAVGDTLGDRVILLDGVESASEGPAASVRFGPDGKLYLALDHAGDARRSGDLGSFNGKVLRLNADGTTPADQAGGSPVFAANVGSPRGLDWNGSGAADRTLWIVEDAAAGTERLQGVVSESQTGLHGVAVVHYTLPPKTGPAGVTFYRGSAFPGFSGDLLVAGGDARAILRLRFGAGDSHRIVASERLFDNAVGAIRAIATNDGLIYFCTGSDLFVVVPEPGAPDSKPPV